MALITRHNVTPNEVVRMFRDVFEACSGGHYDLRADPLWPLREVREIQTRWVRSVLSTYNALVDAPIDDQVFQLVRTTPYVARHVCDEVYESTRILFWEAVRRSLLEGDHRMRTATRLICTVVHAAEMAVYLETDSAGPRVMSPAALWLFDADVEGLRSAHPPAGDEVAQLTWLAPELWDIIGPSRAWLEEQTREANQEAYEEFIREPDQETYEDFIRRSAEREERMLSAARVLWPEPEGYMQRGQELEDDRLRAQRPLDLRPFQVLPLDAEDASNEADRVN